MPFIISKKSFWHGSPRELYYLVDSYRIGTKTKRKTLLKLHEHRSLGEYLGFMESEEAHLIKRLERFELELENFKKYGKVPALSFGSAFKIRKQMDWGIAYTKDDLEECRKKIQEIKSFMR